MPFVISRVAHPWIAGMALAGAGWWLIGLFLGLLGPTSLQQISTLIHLLGLATLLLSGVIFGILWWRNFLRSKLKW